MINLSITQIIELWDELRDCLDGSNRFGGDTAEIYAYQLTKQHIPKAGLGAEGYGDEEEFQIAGSLTNLLQLFCLTHNCEAHVTCSGVGHGLRGKCRVLPQAGQGGSVPPFSHRAHITIKGEGQCSK